jgi:hypothetical protein
MLSQPMCLKVYLLLNLFLEVKRSTILLIDTREEMIYALNEAAEIEHGLMIQYLFAALTMKKLTAGKCYRDTAGTYQKIGGSNTWCFKRRNGTFRNSVQSSILCRWFSPL